jgi:hypothetical protein
MAFYKVPLTNEPDQTLSITLPVNGKNINLNLRVRYNTQGGYWWMTISDANGNVLLDALPLLTGIDLLEQYEYLGIGSAVILNRGNTTLDSPDDKTLGTDFWLIMGDLTGLDSYIQGNL